MSRPVSFFMPITKRDDEQRMVWGYASTEALDADGEIIAKEAMQEAIEGYMQFGALREMHQHWAAGRTQEADFDDKGLYIGAKVVDDQAWEKVKTGTYNGFSVGGEATARIGNKITGMKLIEISLVDRPANPECLFEVFKLEKTPVKKSFNTISRLANVVQEIAWMRDEVKFEEEFEQDVASVLPVMMDEALDKLGEILLAMTAEEIAETKPEGAEPMIEEAAKVEKAEGANLDAMRKELAEAELAEARKALKDSIAERMKAHKEEMDAMQADHDSADAATKEDLDALGAKYGKADVAEGCKCEGKGECAACKGEAEETKPEGEEGEQTEQPATPPAKPEAKEDAAKVQKVVKSALDRVISKAVAANSAELLKLNAQLQDRIAKLEKAAVPPKALRTVEKSGEAKPLVEALKEKIEKGEISRQDAFKEALKSAPREIFN